MERRSAPVGFSVPPGYRQEGHHFRCSRHGQRAYPDDKDVKFRADGSATYMHALGLELDLSEKGLGTQSKRFALLVDDLKVKVTNNQIYSSTFPLHRLMAAIFFLDPTSSAPLLCRVKISFADNVPLLQQASRNTARNVVHLDPPCHNARFKPCAHMGRSDLEIFVEMNQCSRKWQYPICIKKYSLENVIIGPYFQSHDILDAVLWGRCN
uniref:Uncharacterized protein n=1 Tax=Vitis vinifera TaxID=29760 RepID=F6I1X8_VITVI